MKVFCDLDGTLIDISTRHYKVYSELVNSFKGNAVDKATYWDLKRKKTKWIELLPMSSLPATLESDFLSAFISKIEDVSYLEIDKPFEGVFESLDLLKQKHQLYLVSLRRNENNLKQELAWLGLQSHFDEVLSGHSENDGYDVKIALIKERLRGEAGAIIGDTEADIVAGKELGLTTIAVTSGIRDEQFLTELKPDYLVASFAKAATLLA